MKQSFVYKNNLRSVARPMYSAPDHSARVQQEKPDVTANDSSERFQMIIHEIRNPLTAISLANQALMDECRSATQARSLESSTAIILNNVRRIERLLQELMHVTDGLNTPFSMVDLRAIADMALLAAEDRIMLQRAAVMRRYDLPCMVMGHAESLVTAFLNVIVNAIESMETGGGKLWIEIYQVKEEIMVVIKDNGAGMSPETAGRVFEQHYSSKPEGLGLGLYHVKHILEQHNAVFSISSEPGKGTSFFIVLKMRGRNVKPNTCINNRQRSADIFHMIFSPVRNYSTPL